MLRSHVPREVRSTCPPGCRTHFLCREGERSVKNPEAALIREGKYMKRIDLGFTDAEPTVVFDPQDIKEVEDLESDATGEVLTPG